MGRSLSVVLITFDSARYLPRCIEGIRSQTDIDFEVVHIDNGSTDESVRLVRELLPEARTISNGENRGFSVAANQGIDAGSSEFVLLLNPDVFLFPGYARSLVEALRERGEQFGSATGRLRKGVGESIEPTDRIDSKGIRMTRNGRHFDIGQNEADVDGEAVREIFGPSGAAALFRRSMLDDVRVEGEVFDSHFFAYREDADLAWRARLLGWRSIYVPHAVAIHVRRVTPAVRKQLPAKLNMHSVKNRFLLRLNNQGRDLALRTIVPTLVRDLIVAVACLTVEWSSLPAFAWLWQHRRELLARRRAIQARRRLSDRELAHWFE